VDAKAKPWHDGTVSTALPTSPLLRVENLSVDFASPRGAVRVVEDLSFDLHQGETLCIAGESGSGKSVTALSLMGLLPKPGGRVVAGKAHFNGTDLFALPERRMAEIRGHEIAMIFQEPMTSLNPILSIGSQLIEGPMRHLGLSRAIAKERAVEMLDAVRIAEPRRRLKQYPHELSGGMRQRVMIAMAMACRPKILIADEPTTALDVTVQAQILKLMQDLQRETGTAIIMITHDMAVVAETADRAVIMRRGRAVETGTVTRIFDHQEHDYTRALLAAVPKFADGTRAPARLPDEDPLLKVRDLVVRFDVRGGGLFPRVTQRVHAVEKISFDLKPGETLALVGESGCGKSTTGKALLRLVPSHGGVALKGTELGKSAGDVKAWRRHMQMIFQDPMASLDPRMTVGELVAEPLVIHGIASGSEVRDRVAALFDRVGLTPEHMTRYPHEFSGGQRQRICIARALTLSPQIIVADECVSALDVSIQAQILELLKELQDELGVAYLFISHDMAVVEQVSHRVAVMYLGQIVEMGPAAAVLGDPRHPYTKKLLTAVPVADPSRRHLAREALEGEVPSPFRPVDFEPIHVTLRDVGDGHLVADAA
jgi:peptide/nickel transport system ATP-binding protein